MTDPAFHLCLRVMAMTERARAADNEITALRARVEAAEAVRDVCLEHVRQFAADPARCGCQR